MSESCNENEDLLDDEQEVYMFGQALQALGCLYILGGKMAPEGEESFRDYLQRKITLPELLDKLKSYANQTDYS